MNVFLVDISLPQLGVAGNMGQHPQLDLAVVRGQQVIAGLIRHEHAAYAAAFLLTNGDVLQIGLHRGQAAGGGDGLFEAGVDLAVG